MERVWRNRLPVTTPAQALLDLAIDAPLSVLRYALAEAEYRKLLDLSEIERTAGRGKAGSTNLRIALERHEPKLAHTRSRFERAFLELCETHRLPLPDFNQPIERMTVDVLYRDAKLVIELDGGDGHHTVAQMKRDRARDLRLRTLGYTVIRYTFEQVTEQSALVAQEIRQLLARAA